MQRRTVLSGVGTAAAVALAGCSGLTGDGDGGSISDSVEADPEDFEASVSESMDASRGDEVEVTIEAGSEGAELALMPEEGEGGIGAGTGGDQNIGFPWSVDAGETMTDTVEIREDEPHRFWVTEGSADVEAEVV